MRRRIRPAWLLVALATLVVTAGTRLPASAQEFPTGPIELVVPDGPGGSHDLTARVIAGVAHQYLGQPLLVVLKPDGAPHLAFYSRESVVERQTRAAEEVTRALRGEPPRSPVNPEALPRGG